VAVCYLPCVRTLSEPVAKSVPADLAFLGGQPAFAEPLHVGRPNIGQRSSLLRRVEATLDSRWLTNDGPHAREFERRVAEIAGVEHAVATCNATIALEIAIRALGLTGEVLVPSFTFIATPNAIRFAGLTPIFCDVDPATHNIDAADAERRITERTSGILAVHVWGRSYGATAIEALAAERNLKVLFDAAHAFGCSYGDRPIGGRGKAEVFSFHATKYVHSGEGGAIVTNDSEIAARARLLRNFGFTDYDHTESLGTNGKMPELSAALGLSSLESMEEFRASNDANYRTYALELRDIPGIQLVPYERLHSPNYQYVVLEVDSAATGLSRDAIVEVLHAENVLARRYFFPGCHKMAPYAGTVGSLPNTEAVAGRVLSLPTGTSVTAADVTTVCSVIRTAVRHSDQIRSAS